MLVSSTQGSVTTPNPNLGNDEVLETRGVFLRSMDGTPYSYKTSPSKSTYNIQIEGMLRSVSQNLLGLIHDSMGAGVTITFTWPGTILVGNIDMQSINLENSEKGVNMSLTITREN